MKTLIVLSLLQTAILVFLVGKVITMEGGMDETARVDPPAPVRERAALAFTADPDRGVSNSVDEGRLREIIREEFAAQLSVRSEPESRRIDAQSSPPVDQAEFRERREAVAQQIEYYESVGRMSEMEMGALYSDMARLDQAGRTEMLKKLTQALNSGAIDARL